MTIRQALVKLSRSRFRGRFKLNEEMRALVESEGLNVIRAFAVDRIRKCLAPAEPERDGHQTPLKGHPVFVAQHATAMCCRVCMNHWWRVPLGVAMTDVQQDKAVNLVLAWIEMQCSGGIEQLISTMSDEEIASIPFWKGREKFKCPYRINPVAADLK